VAVRDTQPEHFLAVHEGLFALRHDEARDLRDEDELRRVLEAAGADADAAFATVATGAPLEAVRKEHEAAVSGHDVWGVPTFIVGDHAVFVRLMDRPTEAEAARRSIERIVEMAGDWPALNEFKHTSLSQ
jgi:2-hydroxychromene-2-carboxylate isomerase